MTSSTRSFGARALCRPPAVTRIDESVQPRPGEEAGPSGRHLAHELRQGALRQGVAVDLLGERELGDLRRVDEGAADDAPQQALMSEVVGAERFAVAEADRMQRGDVARRALGKKAPLERRKQRFGNGMTSARAADQDACRRNG